MSGALKASDKRAAAPGYRSGVYAERRQKYTDGKKRKPVTVYLTCAEIAEATRRAAKAGKNRQEFLQHVVRKALK